MLSRGRLSRRTNDLLMFELQAARLPLRQNTRRPAADPKSHRLHFGCGFRLVPGWHNIDALSGDECVDLRKPLPFKDSFFEVIVSQHVVEHLAIEDELKMLLEELHRVLAPGGELFLSTPDMLRLCQEYITGSASRWLESCKTRHPQFTLGSLPTSHMVNYTFHQNGEHKNLFDKRLLQCCLEAAGFTDVQQITEKQFSSAFPEFPKRMDGDVSLYVSARKSRASD
jgi:predicted SAM-dependent methyltransferase